MTDTDVVQDRRDPRKEFTSEDSLGIHREQCPDTTNGTAIYADQWVVLGSLWDALNMH